jgi:hypothetical protein
VVKFTITFKDPDGVWESIQQAARDILAAEGTPEHRHETLKESVRDEIMMNVTEWITYGEYVTIEFDTEAKTATVVKVK